MTEYPANITAALNRLRSLYRTDAKTRSMVDAAARKLHAGKPAKLYGATFARRAAFRIAARAIAAKLPTPERGPVLTRSYTVQTVAPDGTARYVSLTPEQHAARPAASGDITTFTNDTVRADITRAEMHELHRADRRAYALPRARAVTIRRDTSSDLKETAHFIIKNRAAEHATVLLGKLPAASVRVWDGGNQTLDEQLDELLDPTGSTRALDAAHPLNTRRALVHGKVRQMRLVNAGVRASAKRRANKARARLVLTERDDANIGHLCGSATGTPATAKFTDALPYIAALPRQTRTHDYAPAGRAAGTAPAQPQRLTKAQQVEQRRAASARRTQLEQDARDVLTLTAADEVAIDASDLEKGMLTPAEALARAGV